VCLHAAASGTTMFRRWGRALPDDVELVLVTMPGRERRVLEAPITDYPTAAADVTAHLADVVRSPYALFGHSMGALLALGVAARLESAGSPPLRLVVSGCPAPQEWPDRRSGHLSDAQLVEGLRRHGGTDPEIFRTPSLLELVLPIYRADLLVCDSFRPPATPLSTPISVLGGDRDDFGAPELAGWRDWSSAEVTVRMFPGGHFFVNGESESAVIGSLATDLLGIATGSRIAGSRTA
jgi:surfactin synthase thioesterase subunit